MTRYRVMIAVLTLLALPLGAGTEQRMIHPEAIWTATAPTRGTLTSGALGPHILMHSPQLNATHVERTIETVTPFDLLILVEVEPRRCRYTRSRSSKMDFHQVSNCPAQARYSALRGD